MTKLSKLAIEGSIYGQSLRILSDCPLQFDIKFGECESHRIYAKSGVYFTSFYPLKGQLLNSVGISEEDKKTKWIFKESNKDFISFNTNTRISEDMPEYFINVYYKPIDMKKK